MPGGQEVNYRWLLACIDRSIRPDGRPLSRGDEGEDDCQPAQRHRIGIRVRSWSSFGKFGVLIHDDHERWCGF